MAEMAETPFMSRTTYARRALCIAMVAILGVVALPVQAEGTEPTDPPPAAETPEPEPEPAPTDEPAAPAKPKEPPKPPGATFTPVKRIDVVKKLVFPVVGITRYWSGFGDCRDGCTREHHGIDIMTYDWKGLPVVAATSGTVTKVTYNEGNPGCSIRIRSRDGWETRYLHLNNDVPGSDQVGHPCPAPGIGVGTKVEAGQVIGWIGDSGNAEKTQAHLHFELRNRSGYPIDPYRSLKKSAKVVYEWLSPDPSTASIALSEANQPDGAPYAFLVSSADVHRLEQSETAAAIYRAPLIVIDMDNPQPALNEIARLNPSRLLMFTDDTPAWLLENLKTNATLVETAALPTDTTIPIEGLHAGMDEPMVEPNTPDRFATIIAGRVDKIWRSRQDEYATFTEDHRSLVLTDSRWASRSLGEESWNSPGRHADGKLLWWHTGDGWVGTRTVLSPPAPGFAYLTERRATPWNLAFLGSLAELPPMPLWRN
jgi:murein DD-endopeptidase MepM/ murein hydrolase activator NlpD